MFKFLKLSCGTHEPGGVGNVTASPAALSVTMF
jgi:hypothetical protein